MRQEATPSSRTRPLSGRRAQALVLLCLIVYFICGLSWISLPGPQHDEVIFLNVSLPRAMHLPVLHYIQIFDWDIPGMMLSYVGALKGWLWWMLFLIWDPSIWVIRIPAVVIGGAALLLFYLWTRRWYPPAVALAALALAATDPTYIHTSRLDWGPVALNHLLLGAALLLGTKWYQRQTTQEPGDAKAGRRLLAAAGFCLGLALWDKATTIWFLAAFAVTVILLFPRQLLGTLRLRTLGVFVPALLLGAFPLILFNIKMKSQGTATRLELEQLTPDVLATKLNQLRMALSGESTYELVGNGLGPLASIHQPGAAGTLLDIASAPADKYSNPLLLFLAVGLALVPFLGGYRRRVLFPYLIVLLMWPQMVIAKNGGFGVHHLVLMAPFPQLALAAAAGAVWHKWLHEGTWRRWLQPLVAGGLAFILMVQVSWNARYLRMYRETGGGWLWSDAINEIAAAVRAHHPQPLYVMDWGFSNQLLLLGRGSFKLVENYWAPDEEYLAAQLGKPNLLFLVHTKERELFPGGSILVEKIAPRHGVRCMPVRHFRQGNGAVIASLLECKPKS